MHAFVNNEVLHVSKAFLHISDLSIHRGYGIFDFFKISDDHVFFIDDYLDRFYNSAAIMRLTVPLERKKLVQVIHNLIQKNALKDSGIKMVLTGGYSGDGYTPANPNLIMTHHNLTLPGPDQIEKGVKIITHQYVRDIPEAKTINYTMGIWLMDKVREQNAYDILYHTNGVVSEFPRCNFFIVTKDNVVKTPANNVLKGITRKNVLTLASQYYQAEEAEVSMDDILNAREAFLTSTTKRIIPIVQMDNTTIGNGKPGEVSLSLLEKLKAMEEHDRVANAYPRKFYGF